jgi:hypothetical protein
MAQNAVLKLAAVAMAIPKYPQSIDVPAPKTNAREDQGDTN